MAFYRYAFDPMVSSSGIPRGCYARESSGALNAGQAWKQHEGNDLWD